MLNHAPSAKQVFLVGITSVCAYVFAASFLSDIGAIYAGLIVFWLGLEMHWSVRYVACFLIIMLAHYLT